MADTYIRVGRIPGPNDIRLLSHTLDRMNSCDQLVIIMDANDAHQADGITTFLAARNMDYQPHGSHDGNEYRIIARRRA